MCDELASVEAERDDALALLKLQTAFLVYLANDLSKKGCLECRKALDAIFEHFSNPNMTL